MRGLKSLTFMLAIVGIVLGAALVPSVSAQATAPGLIKEIKDELSALDAKWVHIDEILNDIDEEIAQMRAFLMAAMRLISSGQSGLGTLVHDYIAAAIQEKEVIITVKLNGDLNDFLESVNEEVGALIGKVEAAFEENKLNIHKKEKIVILLEGINQLVELIGSDAASMTALLEDGDVGENPDDTQTFDDVDDWLEFCLENQVADEQNDFEQCRESLGKALGLLNQFVFIKALIFKKKKFAVKKLFTVINLMRNTGAPVIKRSEAGFGTLGSSAVRVYTLSGQLVVAHNGGYVSLESLRDALANGTYIVVAGNRVEKLVVLH